MRRTVSFRSVLWGVAKRDGQVPESNDLTPDIAVQMTEGINTAYRYGWEYFDWPEACEYGQFTPTSSPGTGSPWLSYLPTAGVQMATVFGIWQQNPLVFPDAKRLGYTLGPDGVYFHQVGPMEPVWVRYRPDPPVFNAVEWDGGASYVNGDVVYYSVTGQCYMLWGFGYTPGSAPGVSEQWVLLPVLTVLSDAVKAGAFALYLGGDGQAAASGLLETAMDNALATQVCLIHDQMEVVKHIRR